ncbi:MAG TPA: glycoside hydrolase family 31 protein, partial [Candidatus Acidoferrum sp.]|nr:glycoside hydrolase family 31 protein [Candidatus Acidoferrum sp.]
MKLKKIVSIYVSVVAVAGNAVSAPDNVEKNSNGLLIHLGQEQVELAAANTNTFRLSIFPAGTTWATSSTFLADTNADNPVAWQMAKHRRMIGVRTTSGELLMNPKTGEWTLENSHGKILIPKHNIGDLSPENSSVAVSLGWMKHQPISVYGCGNGTNSLEQSKAKTGLGNGRAVIPYYWSHAGYAVLTVSSDDNHPARWKADADGTSVTWTFPGRTADLYLMPAPTPKDAAGAYAKLTGHAPVPPRWAFGYLQSRWGWTNRAYIEDTLKKFNDLKLPVDAFIFDFEWYTRSPDYSVPPGGLAGFEDFSWNTNLFPNPAEQIESYKEQGVHFVGIRKPRLGNPDSLTMMRNKQWGLMGTEGLEGFQARDINFANPNVRDWYVAQSADLLKAGVDGWWNDEGEASFTTYYYWNLAEQKTFAGYKPNIRLWTLNRAFSPGLQRLGAAAWTGDIKASWDVFASTPTTLLNWNLAGLPYETCDIGGFFSTPTPELLSRWMEAGVFFPVLRTHSVIDVKPHFPWLFGPDALDAIRKALDLRYQLIPYYYSLAHQTFETGIPLMRPLVMEFPRDPAVANISDEWLMGPSLLAAPILTPGGKRTVY